MPTLGIIRRHFVTTHWHTVDAARSATAAGECALALLCEAYWYPLYAFLRRTGSSPEDAADLVQGFLGHALDAQIFQQARQQGGRLRSLLLTCLQNYRRNAVRRDHAAKRGGAPAVALEDLAGAESRLEQFTTHTETPERIFDRDWALELIRQVIEQLQREQVAAGHGKRFQILAAHLMEKDSAVAHFDLASQLGISEGAARIALHRLRQRCQQLVNSELRKLVDSPEEVAAELRHLVSVLARPSTLLTN